MEAVLSFFGALWELSNAMAPYILFGLLFAGILHETVPDSLVTRHLGNDSVGSIVKSTLFGIPLPVCSCGVIPLATSIKKSGASNGATLSFLISTPITGVDSILATFGMFGWLFTLYRLITSMIIATVAGILTNLIAPSRPQSSFAASPKPVSLRATTSFSRDFTTFGPPEAKKNAGCCANENKKGFSLSAAIRYAFVTLLGDIAAPLLWGVLLGAAITVAIPENLSEILRLHPTLSYLIAIAIAVPMYVCATASLPIAAGLMLSGVSAGAAFVFLSAGPATNTVTIGVVRKMLGDKTLFIYLFSIVVGSILFGLGLDALFSAGGIDVTSIVHTQEEGGVVAIASSLILWALVFRLLFKSRFSPKKRSDTPAG